MAGDAATAGDARRADAVAEATREATALTVRREVMAGDAATAGDARRADAVAEATALATALASALMLPVERKVLDDLDITSP
ncbi:MAG: hypothetical protein ACREU8_00240 [Gammaproteobacteria bacterium]